MTLERQRIYGILEDLGGVLADVVNELRAEADRGNSAALHAYYDMPVPTVASTLLRFGQWPDSIPQEEREEEAYRLAYEWVFGYVGKLGERSDARVSR